VSKPRIIALEEHFWDAEMATHFDGAEARSPKLRERLFDLGEMRLRSMDEAGIDVQVLSQGAPATHRLQPSVAVPLARAANDRLQQVVEANPARFAAFATLPAGDPKAAADELERTVTRLGFKGAMVHGFTEVDGKRLFIDDKFFWPIFERAAALDVPIYLHPAAPHPAVIEAYYKDYAKDFPQLLSSGWGFTVETATQAIRIVLSGVLQAYPGLKLILGHMGESLPFSVWRINQALSRAGNRGVPFRDLFCEHFYITTSGNFFDPALLCSVMAMGVDRILFSVDYPFVDNLPGVEWMQKVPLSTEDKHKILHGNAARLLKL
jgi:predicted TIM-barrel fold metal-dependent hydrolase